MLMLSSALRLHWWAGRVHYIHTFPSLLGERAERVLGMTDFTFGLSASERDWFAN